MATITQNKNLTEPAFGDSGWNTTLNTNFTNIDAALGAAQTINVTSLAGNYTFTSAYPAGNPPFSYIPSIIIFSGTLSSSLIFTFPVGVGGNWVVNTASVIFAGYNITLQTSGGAGVTFSSGATYPIYSDGVNTNLSLPPASAPVIPSGSITTFVQASAPLGWTQLVCYNDYGIRVVSGTGGGLHGTTAFSTVFSNQTPTISVNTSGLSIGATTLTICQIPSHSHGYTAPVFNGFAYNGGCAFRGLCTELTSTCATGGGHPHAHSLNGSATATSSVITLNLKYIDFILCVKN
jgi:hypothetical protein